MKKLLAILLFSSALLADNMSTGDKDKLPFTAYKPTYLLFGDDQSQVKMQISFKYELIQDWGFFLGYSQLMFWDVYKTNDSSPMREINYNPEFFWKKDINFATFRYIQLTPFEHKSNGRASGALDRTWDRSGLTVANGFDLKYFEFLTYVRGYYAYNLGSYNEDIRNYMGYTELRLAIRSKYLNTKFSDNEEISVRFISGFNGLGAREYGVRFRTLLPHFSPQIYFQVWEGYGENLVDYNKYSQAYRIGLIFQ